MNLIKKLSILILAITTMIFSASAQTFPAPSPKARTYQMVGLTSVEVEYSSPAVNGRNIFGDLVPYGELWRTGANRASKLMLDGATLINGKTLEAGEYSIFTIPNEKEVAVIFNKNPDQGGTGDYDEAMDAVRVTVPFKKSTQKVERMRFTIENTTLDGADIVFAWADRSFTVPMKVMTEERANTNFELKMKEFEGQFSVYNEAANYYLGSGNLEKAKEMAMKSTEMESKFWNVHTLAKVYKAMGDKPKALEAAQKSMKLAQEAEYKPYIRLNEKLIAELK